MNIHLVFPIMAAALLPHVCTVIAKVGAFGPKQNHRTRDWQAEQKGWRKRATWAMQNSFEVFPMFAVGVLLAALLNPGSSLLLPLAWAFIGTRVLYIALYVGDRPQARSLTFFLGAGCVLALYIEALRG